MRGAASTSSLGSGRSSLFGSSASSHLHQSTSDSDASRLSASSASSRDHSRDSSYTAPPTLPMQPNYIIHPQQLYARLQPTHGLSSSHDSALAYNNRRRSASKLTVTPVSTHLQQRSRSSGGSSSDEEDEDTSSVARKPLYSVPIISKGAFFDDENDWSGAENLSRRSSLNTVRSSILDERRDSSATLRLERPPAHG